MKGIDEIMDQKIKKWLKERQILCEENFGEALHDLVVAHSKDSGKTLLSIWKELEITKQNVNYWMYHQRGTTDQLNIKRKVINNARNLFKLSESETRKLANKAGLEILREDFSFAVNNDFVVIFSEKLNKWNGNQKMLYEAVGIHKSMFYRIKSGKNLRKETLLSIFLVMNLTLDEIRICLEAAGYTLSTSLPIDLLICHLLQHDLKEFVGIRRLYEINYLLYELEQPFLAGFEK